jgi:hypothetical protein
MNTYFAGNISKKKSMSMHFLRKQPLLFTLFALIVCVALVSWGVVGHRTIGKIAENHLNQRAKAAVQELLGNQTLADVSTWADEIRSQPEYRNMGTWHYVDLPLGMNFAEFSHAIEGMEKDNVYKSLLKQEQILGDRTASPENRAIALKWVVHLVGDLHQPMHVSREEDKGGNTIQLNFNGTGTNLHALWDTKLVERQGLSYEQLADKYDHVSEAQAAQWMKDPLMKWLWESYEISTKLYAEVDAMKSRAIDDSYYQEHVATIQLRMTQAGVRLAGVLNEILGKK